MNEKLESIIKTINNMQKMFEEEEQDCEVIFALEELKEQIYEIIKK